MIRHTQKKNSSSFTSNFKYLAGKFHSLSSLSPETSSLVKEKRYSELNPNNRLTVKCDSITMPPKLNKVPIDVVEIDSSDDEGSRRTNAAGKSSGRDVTTTVKNPRNKPPGFHGAGPVAPPAPNHRQPDSRSFWKAGNYEVASTRAVAIEG